MSAQYHFCVLCPHCAKRRLCRANSSSDFSIYTPHGGKSGAGFSLVEIIIYTAILGFLLVAVVDLVDITQTSRLRFVIRNLVQVTAARVLNTTDALVRNADGFVIDASD